MDYKEVIAVQAPITTDSYKPVLHENIINITKEVCDKLGLVIESEKYLSACGGQIITGYYDIKDSRDKEIGTRIIFQNSYNKKVTVKYAVGGFVRICQNGMVRGDLGAYKRRHVGKVDSITSETIKQYLENAESSFTKLIEQKDMMKQIEVNETEVSAIIGDLYIYKELIKERQFATIKKEILKPSFDYGAKNSLWELYNHVTYSLKECHAAKYIENHSNINKYFYE